MNDPLPVGMLNAFAHLDKEFKTVLDIKSMGITVLGDRNAADVLHGEVRPSLWRGTGIEDTRNVGVVHHGESLTLGFKPGHNLLRVHADFDHFQGHCSAHRANLFRFVHLPHSAFAALLQKTIVAYGFP